ncbi:MAG: helix-turn-helix transcriptional regulator, partial [Acidimicrobiia bacterium]|nr:helix-turn-helix transcriptional regulator [Acidimicrobiia bacterium]
MGGEPDASLAAGAASLAAGRWGDARAAFEASLAAGESAEACFGLASALWWLGESHACVAQGTRAYSLFRRQGAVQCAVWLSITYKADFGNVAAANGWARRAERLLEALDPGPLHGWALVARAYRMPDLDAAEGLTDRAAVMARDAGDVDLELVALAQLGLIRVGKGQAQEGFALIDEAMAAALAGERSSLDTVVYACCDMLTACELASDVERAAQWCEVADAFVATYGCPFLYAECRMYYGSVLTAKGRWRDADRELTAALRIAEGAGAGVHARARARLADLRIRQGRLEEAERLLVGFDEGVAADAETTLSLAALSLARGDAPAASRRLRQRLRQVGEHRAVLAGALDLLVDACLASGEVEAAYAAAARLADLAGLAGLADLAGAAGTVAGGRVAALAASARGRVSMARGETEASVAQLEAALAA